MGYFLKRIFQAILLLIWGLTLIYLIFLSTFTFLLFNLFLTIFLFWFLITLIAWCIAFIPILKFIFIPWHRQQCRLWTTNDRQSRLSVAFFHPYCNDGGETERVLWTAVETIIKKYKNDIQIIIYTGDVDVTPEEILQRVKQRFALEMEIYKSSITFIYLQSRSLVEAKYYKIFTLLGQTLGSVILSFEALIRFIPDIYIDSMGYAFTYPCFYYLASVPIISYVHYPTINTDTIKQVNEQCAAYNNPQIISESSLISQIQLIYYEIFSYIYGWCGRCSQIVYCNSLWTKRYIESIWGLNCIHLVYPPCDVKQFLELPFINEDEQTIKTIVSVGQFRAEENHELQIRAFYELLQREPAYHQTVKLILIGSPRHNDDRNRVESLKLLIDNLNMNEEVELKLNVSFQELKSQLHQAVIGLHTMKNEPFGIGIVEMMAAGSIVLAHKSGGPKMDIIDEGQTGFLASDIDSYATMMQEILEMKSDKRHQIRERARDSVDRFSKSNFQRLFMEPFDEILSVK